MILFQRITGKAHYDCENTITKKTTFTSWTAMSKWLTGLYTQKEQTNFRDDHTLFQ